METRQKARVSDAIEGLVQTHQFWSRQARDRRISSEQRTEAFYLDEMLPTAAPLWIAPHICPLIAAGGASYPLTVPIDPEAVPFGSAWVWLASPLPIGLDRGVRALLIRACQAKASDVTTVTPVSDPSIADGLWVHIFLERTDNIPAPTMIGMVAIEYARPGEWIKFARHINDNGQKLLQEDLDEYVSQGETVIRYTLALLAFLRQKVVVEERKPMENHGAAKRFRRGGYKGDMAVRVITLRAAAPTGAGHGEHGGYSHRFMVRGHWRQQAHGPHRSLRRATWIDSFIKGDESLPLAQPQWTAYKVAR